MERIEAVGKVEEEEEERVWRLKRKEQDETERGRCDRRPFWAPSCDFPFPAMAHSTFELANQRVAKSQTVSSRFGISAIS